MDLQWQCRGVYRKPAPPRLVPVTTSTCQRRRKLFTELVRAKEWITIAYIINGDGDRFPGPGTPSALTDIHSTIYMTFERHTRILHMSGTPLSNDLTADTNSPDATIVVFIISRI